MREKLYYEDNGDGWALEVRHYVDPETIESGLRPVLMIPGYCMNTFILNFHPTRKSMVRFLVDQGFEVWTANLRGQGGARQTNGVAEKRFGFGEVSLVDVPTALRLVRRETHTDHDDVDTIGCSLGATYLYGYLAHHMESHGIGSLVALGGPLRWTERHPLLRAAFASPTIAGSLRIYGTRKMARTFLPVAEKFPLLLSIYMNTDMIDLSEADQLVRTVDDPVPYLNRQISHWIREIDLEVRGVNVTDGMQDFERPVLAVVANADGIVPASTATSILDVVSSDVTDVLHVGDDENWFAHADLFINDEAHERVFEPLADWLKEQNA